MKINTITKMTVWRENPTARICLEDETWWYENPQDPNWIYLGFAPRPVTKTQCFLYHLHHGLMMKYKLRKVISYSFKNRKSFL